MNVNRLWFFLLFFLTSCAGFYTKSDQVLIYQQLKADELNVFFEMSFNNADHFVDEIEISSKALYENRVNSLKENIINSLKTANPSKKMNILPNADKVKNGCLLTIIFNEKLNSKSMLATGLTLGIWPYIDTRVVTIKSKLTKDTKLISESSTIHQYKVVFSIFAIPLAPFKTIQKAEKDAWEDAYKLNLSKIEFAKCE